MKTNPDDSVTPQIRSEEKVGEKFWTDTYSEGGLTKREYFAVMAMQSFIRNNQSFKQEHYEESAKRSCACADALITELNKQQP